MSRKAQVWIETVIYTLILITIMGVVLGIVKPAIDQKKDQAIISQSIDILNNIDQTVNEVKYAPGNSRELGIKMTKGKLLIDGTSAKVIILIDDSSYQYGEIGQQIHEGNIIIENSKKGKLFAINLTLDYMGKYNLTWDREHKQHFIQPGSTLQNILITNMGKVDASAGLEANNATHIDFS